MEDIAKIYESNGKLDTAIAWLKQARISGGICWGPSVSLEHIHDKLMRLLNGCGRGDEAGLWSTAFGPAARHDCSGQLGQGEGRLLSLVRNGIVRRMEYLLAAVLSRGQATNTGLVVGSTTVTAIPASYAEVSGDIARRYLLRGSDSVYIDPLSLWGAFWVAEDETCC
ncbi:hypothetical protein MAJ_09885, partial [Metarhizium majus ARSEF 297]